MREAVVSRLAGLAAFLFISAAAAASAQTLSIDLGPGPIQPGDAVLVRLQASQSTMNLEVTAFGANWPHYRADDGTWRALIGVDLDRRPGTYAVTVTTSDTPPVTAKASLTVAPKTFRRRVLSVNPDFVNPPASQQARIEQDAALMRSVYTHVDPDQKWGAGMIRPVKDPANSSFGTRSVFNGQARSPHAGTDFLSGLGTPILAPAAGHIAVARDLYFTGNTVVIDHGLGVVSMLAHLSRLDVKEGASVARGDVVGLVGATGRVTGPHLHWALRVGSARVDPLSALAVLPVGR